ncbi:MAG: endonuclease/exonuclease/phosphatase family protein [archaeon]
MCREVRCTCWVDDEDYPRCLAWQEESYQKPSTLICENGTMQRIRLLTLNTWLLPFPLALDRKLRLQRTLALIRRLKPDIICLQEVWLGTDVKKIRRALSTYYAHAPDCLFNRSGMMFFSRFPITRTTTISIGKGEYWYDAFLHRQALCCHVEAHIPLKIYAVHLNSCDTDDEAQRVLQQFKYLNYIRQKNAFLMGDLNLDKHQLLPHLSAWKVISPLTHTLSSKNPYDQKGANLRRHLSDRVLDYVLVSKQLSHEIVSARVIKRPLYSDHYPVLVDVHC